MLSPGCLVQARPADPPAAHTVVTDHGAARSPHRAALPWPLPALCAWAMAWATFVALRVLGAPAWLALAVAVFTPVALLPWAATSMRRWLLLAGFPLSLLALQTQGGMPAVPPWAWLVPLLALLLVYPRKAWRDAPLFPTPPGALDGLDRLLPLPAGACVLDAGCGLGDGLAALRRVYPAARFDGIEWSWPVAVWARWRCPWARVRRGDMWAAPWQTADLVYLFQRPESMARAVAKAQAELKPGAWLASLEFPADQLLPHAVLQPAGGGRARPVWLYRAPFVSAAAGVPAPAPRTSRKRR